MVSAIPFFISLQRLHTRSVQQSSVLAQRETHFASYVKNKVVDFLAFLSGLADRSNPTRLRTLRAEISTALPHSTLLSSLVSKRAQSC
jgi:hypothetical protein